MKQTTKRTQWLALMVGLLAFITLPSFAAGDEPSSWDKAKQSAQEAWSSAKEAGQEALEASKEKGSEVWQDAGDGSRDLWDKTKQKSGEWWEQSKQKGSEIIEDAGNKANELLNSDEAKEKDNEVQEKEDTQVEQGASSKYPSKPALPQKHSVTGDFNQQA